MQPRRCHKGENRSEIYILIRHLDGFGNSVEYAVGCTEDNRGMIDSQIQ